jgi:hypothetical protein
MEHLIITKCRWHQWDAQFRYMRIVKDGDHGRQIHQMDGTYVPHRSITDAMLSIAKTRKAKEFQILSISNTNTELNLP